MSDRPWHKDVGKMPDAQVAEKYGVSVNRVRNYRVSRRIPSWKPRWTKYAGKMPDWMLAQKVDGLTEKQVVAYRFQAGIPKYVGPEPDRPPRKPRVEAPRPLSPPYELVEVSEEYVTLVYTVLLRQRNGVRVQNVVHFSALDTLRRRGLAWHDGASLYGNEEVCLWRAIPQNG